MPADVWQADAADVMLSVRDDGKWACFEYAELVSRQNGKGGIGEIRVLAGLFLLGERLIMWSAHEYKTAMEAFRRILWLLKQLGEQVSQNIIEVDGIPIKVNNTNGEESFERLDTGQRVKFIARSKGSGRGFSGDVNIIDEAFAYTPVQHAALLPTVSARPNPQFVYLSSPPLDGDSGEVLFDLRDRGERGDDPGLGWRDWGVAGELETLVAVDLDDRELWAAANPALGIRITEETIARERRSMGAVEFARERLGIWPRRASDGGGVLDPQVWADMADPTSRRDGDVALMLDLTPMRDHGSIGLAGVRTDGLEHLQLVDYRPGVDWMVARAVELRDALEPICFVIDAKNGAAALLDALAEQGITVPEDPEQPRRGDVLVLDAHDMSDAVGQFIDVFRLTPTVLRHTGQEPLDTAVRNAKVRQIGDAGQIAWGRKLSEVDIGPLVTVTGARYGLRQWQDLVTADYDVLDSVL
jgi:phage terminase large subunit-like protein